MTSLTVDLSSVSGPVYSGRDRGEALRKKYNLDMTEDAADVVEVVIPIATYTISSSFFLGLFGPSVRKCGSVDNFERKFNFRGPEFLKPIFHAHASLALQNRSLF
jgi:ribosomal protein L31